MNKLLPQNLLDRAIAYIAPNAAFERGKARAKLALSGSYSGARTDGHRLGHYRPTNASANVSTIGDLPTLRARSSDQMRNSPVAVGALNTNVSHTVGTGLAFSAQIDAQSLGLSTKKADAWNTDSTRRFSAWCYSVYSSLNQQQNFFQQQELAYRSWHERGDVFALTHQITINGAARLALQIIEADHVCNPNHKADSTNCIAGVEIDESTGAHIAYHFAKRHPGDYVAANEWQRREARGTQTGRRNVLHIYKPSRPGQVRGVPWIAPIIEPLKQLQRWSDAELNAAVTTSIFSLFIKMDGQAFQDIFDEESQAQIVNKSSQWSGAMEDGKAINLLPGESVEAPNLGRPNPAFDPFWQAMVRQIGMALEMPFEVLVMHFQSSYSAARAALLMGWKFFRCRRDLFVTMFCAPVYELWLELEIAEGRITAPGFFASMEARAAWCAGTWTGDGPGSIDPQKEVGAARGRVELGISTLDAESVAYDGVPWAVKHAQRLKELTAQREAGVPIAQPANQAMQQVTPQANTQDEKNS